MRLNRCYVPGNWEVGESVALPRTAADHLVKVLRMRAGDRVDIFDGTGIRANAELTSSTRGQASVRVTSMLEPEPEPALQLTLLQAAARSDKIDWVVQKAVELGVSSIRIALTEHSVVRLNAEQSARKLEHWQAVAVAACEQCGRARLPAIARPADFASVASAILRDERPDAFFALHPDAESSLLVAAQALTATPAVRRRVAVAVGPEGGFSDAEIGLLQRLGVRLVGCGPRILRTETAAVTALALLQGALGDLGGR